MNKQRKTSHILNVFQYDADGHVVLPASLTLGIVPGAEDNSGKVPSTAWVRGLLTTRSSTLVPTNRTITINGLTYDLSSNPSFSIDTGVLTATAGAGISVSVSNQNLNIVNTGLLTATSGAGITVSTSNQNVNIVNTGLLTASSGAGITVTTSNQNVNIVNTGLLTATAGSGITVTTSNQNVNIVNNGILTATAGAGISVTTSNGNLNIVNTITNNNQLDNGAGYATTSYVTTQINNLVAGAPGLLDTLDELAAALGDDANFATTTATSLGNRLRIDIGTQGLTSTQQGYGRTNLGLGTAALSATGDFATAAQGTKADTAFGWGNHASAGYLTTSSAASTYASLTGSYANPSWITSLAYSKITGVPAFLTSYTETDTLASVTARGASTTTALSIAGVTITSTSGGIAYLRPSASNGSILVGDDSGSTARGLLVQNNGGAIISTAASGQVILDTQISGTSVLRVNGNQTVTILGNTVLTAGNYSSYALPLTGGTLSGPLTINTTGDIVANGDTFRMKGGGGSAEFIWYRNYSGDPSHPGFVIINRSGTTTFSHNSNGGGTSISGNFSAANFSGSSSGTNTGDQTLSGLGGVPTSGYAFGTSFTLGTMYVGTGEQFTPSFLLGVYSNGYAYKFPLAGIQSWLGLGSAAYQNTSAFVAARSQSNWNDGTVINNVIGMLGWKNYGGNHVIFDASAGTSPSGGGVSQTNSTYAWSASYPTLMGWNGTSTYGVRVDSSRISDNTSGNAATTSQRSFSGDISTDGMGRFTGWYTGTAATTLATEVGVSSGIGHIIVYNRQTSTYGTLNIHAVNINIDPQGGSARVGGSQIVTNNSGTWGISISGNAATASTATDLNAADGTQINFNNVTNTDYSTMTFMSRAWSAVQGANGLAYNFTTHNNNGGGGYGALQIYYGEGGYVLAPTSFRAPIFYDSQDTGYYVDPNGTSRLVQVNLGTVNTPIRSIDGVGYLRIYGSSTNFLGVGPYDNNGWVYFENSGNSNGIYFNSPGRYAFDSVDVTPYTDAENSLGNGSYRWAQVYTSGWLRQYGAQGMYNQDYGTHFYSNGSASWNITGSGGNIELVFRSNHQSTVRGYVYADTSNQIGFLHNGGGWSFRTTSDKNAFVHGQTLTINADNAGWSSIYMNDGDEGQREIHCNSNRIGFLTQAGNWGAWLYDGADWEAASSVRAPIFYDSQDTGYYADFNSTSNSAIRVRGGMLMGPNPTWGAYLQVGGNGNESAYATVAATNGNLHLDAADGYGTYINHYSGGTIYFGTAGTYTITGNGSYYNGRSELVTINYNNDSNSTYQLLWGSGNSVYGTSQVYINPSADIIYARGGYVSPGNPWGTSDSAFFPNGITTAGGTNWIYGFTYIGNAPGNGAGHEFYTSGSSYSTGNVEAAGSMRAPIFYDRNDTNYYVDPNSNSKLVNLGLGGVSPDVRLSASGDIHVSGYIYQGGTAGSVNSWGSRTLVSSGNYVSNAASFTFNNVGYGSTWSVVFDSSGITSSGAVYASNWFRTYGNSGWYSQTYGGGWFMEDSTWIRSYGSKNVYVDSFVRAQGSFRVGSEYSIWAPYGTYSAYMTRIAYISFDWDASYNSYSNHGIASTDRYGNFTDDVSINSYSDINLRIDSNGNDGSEYVRFHHHTTGDNQFAYIGYSGSAFEAYFTGTVYATGDVIAYYSDARLKKEITKIDSALDKLSKINGYYYKPNEIALSQKNGEKDERKIGVLAQEMQQVFPEVVSYAPFDRDEFGNSKSGKDYLTVKYDRLVPVLIEAIKEQQLQIEELQNKLDNVVSSR